jgi:hypothetical protein
MILSEKRRIFTRIQIWMGERIRKAIENSVFRFDGICVRITASLGIHIKKVDGVDIEAVFLI